MAKSVSETMAAALEMFQASGIKVTKEMREALVKQQQDEMREAAATILSRKCVDEMTVDPWVDELFNLAAGFEQQIISETRNVQGRGLGQREVRSVAIETPHGRLRVELSNDAD